MATLSRAYRINHCETAQSGIGIPDSAAPEQRRRSRPAGPNRRFDDSTVVEADENDVDEWVSSEASARGYAPYLPNPEDAAAEPRIQRGVLRSDVIRRRKAKRFDTARPE